MQSGRGPLSVPPVFGGAPPVPASFVTPPVPDEPPVGWAPAAPCPAFPPVALAPPVTAAACPPEPALPPVDAPPAAIGALSLSSPPAASGGAVEKSAPPQAVTRMLASKRRCFMVR